MKVLTTALLLVTLQCSHALSPTNCDASEPLAQKVLDLINKGRRSGYAFQLLRVSDAHLDSVGQATVYYLALDVIESDCWVLSTKAQDDCLPARWPSEIVIGQCKVIATRYSNESQDLSVNDYNCTTSSVSSALGNTKDSPVLLDFFEDSELYREQARKALDKYKAENGDFASFRVERAERVVRARGGERTNYYVDFSVRNCSAQHFPRYPPVFGFCRALLSYSIEATDLETPEHTEINCEVFNPEDNKNTSDRKPHCDKHPCKPSGSRGHHHTPDEFGCPPPPEGKDNSDRPPLQGLFPEPPPGHPPPGNRRTDRPPHNHSCTEQTCPGHRPHGHHPHGHGPHGHHPHGQHPHGHHPHGHQPHGDHPHGHGFLDYGPCDPPSNSKEPKGQNHRGYGPPHGHSRKRGPGKGPFPFHKRQIGYVYRLPPLNADEVLNLPEANFPSFSLPSCNRPLLEIQPFPQTASESCPGKFESKFQHISKFFGYTLPK